jgi:hypothetical protein
MKDTRNIQSNLTTCWNVLSNASAASVSMMGVYIAYDKLTSTALTALDLSGISIGCYAGLCGAAVAVNVRDYLRQRRSKPSFTTPSNEQELSL